MRPNCMHLTRVRPTLQIFTTARALSRLSFDLHGPYILSLCSCTVASWLGA